MTAIIRPESNTMVVVHKREVFCFRPPNESTKTK